MAIPDNRASSVPITGAILPPNNRYRPPTTAYHIGGVDISDPSQGLEVQTWVAQATNGDIHVYPEGQPGAAQTFVTGATEIEFVALAFDQNMRPVLAYTDAGLTKLFWYDSVAQDYTTTDYPGARSPYCLMDDTRDVATTAGTNDVLFLYIAGGELRYRQQRDRYQTERVLSTTVSGRIARAGMTDRLRVQIEFE